MKTPTFAEVAARYRISNGSRFRLADISPADEWGASLKDNAENLVSAGIAQRW